MNENNTSESEAASATADGSAVKTDEASTQGTRSNRNRDTSRADRIITGGAWLVAISFVLLASLLAWRTHTPYAVAKASGPSGGEAAGSVLTLSEAREPAAASDQAAEAVALPPLYQPAEVLSISRQTTFHTVIPTRPRDDVITYTVSVGDSVFGIAKNFNIQPETVLWANYSQLNDSPDMISPGMELKIPPADGVYYQWKEGDTFESVAAQFKAQAEAIKNWPGNNLDLLEPQVLPGQMVLVPGGVREFRQWVVPTIPRGNAGVSKSVYGTGACEGNYDGYYGSGAFVWPSGARKLSGNDYWSGHLGIDIAAGIGDSIFAADSGVVVFAGWAYGGYGYMIMIDHGNGYQTLYAHLSSVSARCGQSVSQGGYIGGAGSTGNSTGAHLHFEIRYMGGFINPWHMLP